MKIAVVGSRNYPDMGEVEGWVMGLPDDTVVVTGGARGVDTVAERIARARGLSVIVHPAEWNTHGRGAGMIRNRAIVDDADYVIAFWDGKSRGTKHTLDLAKKAGKGWWCIMHDAVERSLEEPPFRLFVPSVG